jgi:NAD(P)-dependent dehydrogenase (short-subunit alcohol dehydrogenase family)
MSSITRASKDVLESSIGDKVVLITGAAQGIGFSTALLFARHGAKVVVADLGEERARTAAEKIGHGAIHRSCDVSSWHDQLAVFQLAIDVFGRLDIVVCNAGIDPEIVHARPQDDPIRQNSLAKVSHNYLADETVTKCDKTVSELKAPSNAIFDVNVTGVIYNLKLAIHHMKPQQDGGRVIIVGSAASYVAVPEQDIYAASKHAVLGLMRATSQREEIKRRNISISMVAPWLTETPMTSEIDAASTERVPRSSAEDVAWAIGTVVCEPALTMGGKCIWIQGREFTEVEATLKGVYGGYIKTGSVS